MSYVGAKATAKSPAVPGVLPITGVKYVNGFIRELSGNLRDVYTCPAGKRAFVMGYVFYSQGGTTATTIEIKVGASYFKLWLNSLSAGARSVNNIEPAIILEAGETIAIDANEVTGFNGWLKIVEFDSANDIVVKTVKVTSFSVGDNLIYTTPAEKSAILLGGTLELNARSESLFYFNDSGAARSIGWFVVPNGGSPVSTYRVGGNVSVANLTRSATTFPAALSAGDSVYINVDAATAKQIAWINVLEY